MQADDSGTFSSLAGVGKLGALDSKSRVWEGLGDSRRGDDQESRSVRSWPPPCCTAIGAGLSFAAMKLKHLPLKT